MIYDIWHIYNSIYDISVMIVNNIEGRDPVGTIIAVYGWLVASRRPYA